MPKITIPKYVLDNIEAYNNSALPNNCVDMDREALREYLEMKTGEKIRLRECEFTHCEETTITKNKRRQTYLIAEVYRK